MVLRFSSSDRCLRTESGIEVTVTGCTFYRNFGGFGQGALLAADVWPLVWAVDRTDFIHNEALLVQHDWVYWTAPVTSRAMLTFL